MFHFISILSLSLFSLSVALHNPFGFVAYLYNSEHPEHICTGVIVSEQYILNFCLYGSYKYDTVKVGVKSEEATYVKERTYKLESRYVHPNYELHDFPETDSKYDLKTLFAAQHAIFLDRTVEAIILSQDAGIWPVNLEKDHTLPLMALAFYFPEGKGSSENEEPVALRRAMVLQQNSACNKHFKRYKISMSDDTQFCVDGLKVPTNECCNSHAVLEHDAKVIGIMAWSTACYTSPDPWVFTQISRYYEWITDIINEDDLFS